MPNMPELELEPYQTTEFMLKEMNIVRLEFKLDASGKALATCTQQSRELGGTSWTVTGYNNGQQAVVSVTTDADLTALFDDTGKLSGFAA
jgi:hypothetical protein